MIYVYERRIEGEYTSFYLLKVNPAENPVLNNERESAEESERLFNWDPRIIVSIKWLLWEVDSREYSFTKAILKALHGNLIR